MFRLAGQRQVLAAHKNEAKAKGSAVARGFLRGILWGGLASFGVVGTLSMISGAPRAPQVSDVAPTADTVTASEITDPVPQPVSPPETTDIVAPPTRVQSTVESSPVIEAITATDPAPQISAPTAELQNPAVSPLASDVVLPAETPVTQIPKTDPPETPQPDAELPILTESAAPVEVAIPDVTVTAPSILPETQADKPAVSPDQNAAIAQDSDIAGNQQPAAQPIVPDNLQISAVEPDAPLAVQDTPKVELIEQEDPVSLNQPATSGSKVTTNRLPSLRIETPAETLPEPSEPANEENTDRPSIQRYAAAFENPNSKPLMAIILIDDGTGMGAISNGVDALKSFPYPITFAVDAGQPDAKNKMLSYRAGGFEVMAVVNVPQASSASDAEVSMSVALDEMDQVVAILEGTGTGIQGNKELSDQVTAILADAGLGLVTQPKGFNTAQKLATRAGVPAATLFRDFDGKDQTPTVIRRFLDQAAFKAGQEGAVIMVGRVRPDTISALLLWGLADRAGRVTLAPVSAVLTRK